MKRFLLLFICLLLPCSAANGNEGPKVAVSIKPLHSLVSSIMQGIAEPQLIVSAAGSPHGYNLRPSEVRALHQADLVIWVGPVFESFMAKSIDNIDADKTILTLLSDLPDLTTYPTRKGGQWSAHQGHEKTEHHSEASDPHLWLNPTNAATIVRVVTQNLIAINPGNSSRYTHNKDKLLARLSTLDQTIAQHMKPLKKKKYIVFHDAYQYFEKHYGLSPVGALAIDPERRPGARRLIKLKQTIRDLTVECIFSEPQFEPRLVQILTEGTTIRTGILDPLGADLPPGIELYFILMEQMATALKNGLSGE